MNDIRKKLKDKKSKLGTSEITLDHPAKINYLNGDFKIIPLNLIKPDPNQPRKIFNTEKLDELTSTVLQHGVLQPIIVRVGDTENDIWLIAGERRFRAAVNAGLTEIPAIISKGNPAEIALIENVQREDLNPIERAQAYRRLIEEFGLGTNEVARKVGKSAPTISNTIRLLSLPDAIKDALVAGVITEGHVRPLISLGDPKLMLELFKKILKDSSTVRQTEEIARQAKGDLETREPRNKAHKLWVPELDEMAKQLEEKHSFNKVAISQSRTQAKVSIIIKGDIDVTGPKVKQLYDLLNKE